MVRVGSGAFAGRATLAEPDTLHDALAKSDTLAGPGKLAGALTGRGTLAERDTLPGAFAEPDTLAGALAGALAGPGTLEKDNEEVPVVWSSLTFISVHLPGQPYPSDALSILPLPVEEVFSVFAIGERRHVRRV